MQIGLKCGNSHSAVNLRELWTHRSCLYNLFSFSIWFSWGLFEFGWWEGYIWSNWRNGKHGPLFQLPSLDSWRDHPSQKLLTVTQSRFWCPRNLAISPFNLHKNISRVTRKCAGDSDVLWHTFKMLPFLNESTIICRSKVHQKDRVLWGRHWQNDPRII
jgi:hypothetical protein